MKSRRIPLDVLVFSTMYVAYYVCCVEVMVNVSRDPLMDMQGKLVAIMSEIEEGIMAAVTLVLLNWGFNTTPLAKATLILMVTLTLYVHQSFCSIVYD